MSQRNILILGVIGLLLLAGYGFSRRFQSPEYDFVAAQKANLAEEVSVTGAVKAREALDLAFERGGRVARVLVKVGDKAEAGQVLLSQDNAELLAQVLGAEANLEAEQARLQELRSGPRPEEIQAAETKVTNASSALGDALTNLEIVKTKTKVDLENAENAALLGALKAVTAGKNALLTLTDIQLAHFNGNDIEDYRLADAKGLAAKTLLGGGADLGRATNVILGSLTGGAFGQVYAALSNPSSPNIDSAVTQVLTGLKDLSLALDQVPVTFELTSTEKTNLTSEKNNVSLELNNLSAKQQGIALQKVLNANNLAAAETSVNNARSALRTARADLKLKLAGSTLGQIAAQEARLKAALASLRSVQASLGKSIIRSPISGTVTRVEVKAGEIVAANRTAAAIMADSDFEIETRVPEANIIKVKIGNPARLTLDAYSTDVWFAASVSAIDPAETVIEGLTTYKVTLVLPHADPRIRSGMTANIDIETDKRENALTLPQRALVTRDGKKYVRVLSAGNRETEEVEVETGLLASDGRVEILKGISEGDKVIILEK